MKFIIILFLINVSQAAVPTVNLIAGTFNDSATSVHDEIPEHERTAEFTMATCILHQEKSGKTGHEAFSFCDDLQERAMKGEIDF